MLALEESQMRIRRALKWFGIGLLGIAGLAASVVLGIYVAMGRDLGKSFAVSGEEVFVPTDAASIEEGRRLAQLRGCTVGCHGLASGGAVMVELFDGSRVVAPDLGRIAADYSTVELERAIRHGVRPDGTSVIRIMPVEMFSGLSDRDLGLIIAYLRSLPPGAQELPDSRYGPLARIMGFMFAREFGSVLAAEVTDHVHPPPPDMEDPAAAGRYLAQTVCTECHGDDLRGAPDGSIPSLAAAAAYSRDQFETLMRKGEPLGDRELGLMGGVARSRFVGFADEEITVLHDYLRNPATWAE